MIGDLEVEERDGLARIAKFETAHGIIETPSFMPVINPNIPILTIKQMTDMGAEALITNSYIIRRTSKLDEVARKYGLHYLLGYDGPIMTDSGTFQSHVYSDIEYSNNDIVNYQKLIGSDIITILDIFSEPGFSREKAEYAVVETKKRLEEIGDLGTSILAGPIQGSTFPDLRRLSSELMSKSRAGYLPVGGVVPLMETYRYDATAEIIINAKIRSDFSKPVHLFGGGHPMFMALSVLLGVDAFDSASYVKYAKDDRMLFPSGSKELSKISILPFWSPLRDRYTIKELQELNSNDRFEALALHNLKAIFNELSSIKECIYEQTLWQYAESKARTHPFLFKAFLKILEYRKELEKFQELSKKSTFFYFDDYSRDHPIVQRLKEFSESVLSSSSKNHVLKGYNLSPGFSMGPEYARTYQQADGNIFASWNGIYVPVELESTFPVEQVVSSYDPSKTKGTTGDVFKLPELAVAERAGDQQSESTHKIMDNYNISKVRRIADYQFGPGVGKNIFPDGTTVTVSKNTGRIRSVLLDSMLLATLRARDGFFTLTIEGARRLHEVSVFPRHRVIVNDDSAPFNRKGYNVFFKFILDRDPEIIAGNEVLVVDKDDDLLACGKSVSSGWEMRNYRKGIAVKVLHSTSDINSASEISNDSTRTIP